MSWNLRERVFMRLGIANGVARAADGVNEAHGERVIDFCAEMADVNVDDVGEVFEAFVPDMLDDHGAGEDLADVGDHIFEQGVFFGGQFDPAAGAADTLGEAIDFEVGQAEDVSPFGGRAAQESFNADEELGECKRLGEVIVSAFFEEFDFIGGAVAGGQDEDGGVLGVGAEAAEEVEAADTWEHEVEDDKVVTRSGGELPGSEAVGDDVNGVALGAEAAGYEVGYFLFIFDEKQAHKLVAGGGPSNVT